MYRLQRTDQGDFQADVFFGAYTLPDQFLEAINDLRDLIQKQLIDIADYETNLTEWNIFSTKNKFSSQFQWNIYTNFVEAKMFLGEVFAEYKKSNRLD